MLRGNLGKEIVMMRVISIKEPYATLIKEGIKHIETRSWKTKYRGELYIHASLSKVDKKYFSKEGLSDLISDLSFSHGNIICKVNLVDCIEMTESYILDMKENHPIEYCCGAYEVGRYAWVFEDLEVIDPIEAKGKLGIWRYE